MEVQRLMKLLDTPAGIQVQVQWKGLPPDEDTYRQLVDLHKDVPRIVTALLKRKAIPNNLRTKAKAQLYL